MNYEEIKDYRNKHNKFAIFNGAFMTEIREGYGRAEMEVTENSLNPFGSVHGGSMCMLADIACGGAASSYGRAITTVDLSISFIKAGINTKKIVGEAHVKKCGKKLCFLEFTIKNENGEELAFGTASFMFLDIPFSQ